MLAVDNEPSARDAIVALFVERLETHSDAAISSMRRWTAAQRFFALAAHAIETDHAPLAETLRRASPH